MVTAEYCDHLRGQGNLTIQLLQEICVKTDFKSKVQVVNNFFFQKIRLAPAMPASNANFPP